MIRRVACWILFLPVQTALFLLFLAADAGRGLVLLLRRSPVSDPDAPDRSLSSIVVLNWNGRHLLEESLPALRAAVVATGRPHQILVVDNGSSDDSVEWLRAHHPEVEVLQLETNLGFGEGNNRGVRAAHHDLIVLLNNDMLVERDFLEPLLQPFKNPSVFAVSSQIEFPPGKQREETGNTSGRLRAGYLHLSHDPLRRCHQTREALPVLWAGGGSSAFDRQKFLQLGGFSDLFSPCYLEDTDLSYRAWRRGWEVLFSARSRVIHKHRSSSSARFQSDELQALIEERKLWYLWKNFPLRRLVLHFLLIPGHFPDKLPARVYLRALRRLGPVLRSRFSEPPRRNSHHRLERWVARPLSFLNERRPVRARQTRRPGEPLRILSVSAYLPHLGTHGGAGRVFQLLRQVSRRHQVTVVSFVETEQEAEQVRQLDPFCRRVERVFRREFEPLSAFPYEPFEEFNCLPFRERLEELLAAEDFDLVHFEWTQMALYADLVPQFRKLLTEIEVNYAAHHSVGRLERRIPRKIRLFYNTLQTLYREIELCGRVDRVICVTDEDARYLSGYVPPEKLRVVNTGVDTGFFSYCDPAQADSDTLLFVGAFRHDPNVDAMIYYCREVFPLILRERPGTRLFIVGSSPPLRIRQLGSHPRITVTGFVEDIRDHYRLASVVVVPLRTGVGIRGKILEGWAAGKAMVATRLACQGIRAAHGENIIISDDPAETALWTLALLRSREFRIRLGVNGRRLVEEQYDWTQVGSKLVRTYEELADEQFDA